MPIGFRSSKRVAWFDGAPVSGWWSTPGRRVTLAVASLLLAGVLAFGALSPPERCPDVTADGLRDAVQRGRRRFDRNQNADGSWLYLYQAPTDTIPDDYIQPDDGLVAAVSQRLQPGHGPRAASADRP